MKQREIQTIVEETKGVVLNAVRRYLSRDLMHAIDDVVQETYIRVYCEHGEAGIPRGNAIQELGVHDSENDRSG